MTRYRLEPTAAQAHALLRHCADARYVWNLCVEQQSCWRADRGRMPGPTERCRQLTDARADNPWLAEGSVMVQQRKLAKARRGSARRGTVKMAVARLRARERDRRKDWAEKVSTDLARRFDVIRVEALDIPAMTRSARGTADAPGRSVAAKAGLNRGILKSGWGLLVHRIADKAPGRVEKINPAFTSQCCSACGHVARESRESQALFRCVACGFACNADVNAARNIAAGHAVKARGGDGAGRPVNREPQHSP
jgi:transposase